MLDIRYIILVCIKLRYENIIFNLWLRIESEIENLKYIYVFNYW